MHDTLTGNSEQLCCCSAASHHRYVVQVGVDTKAVSDAWSVIEKKHGDKVAALFVSVDDTKGKALAYAGRLAGPAPTVSAHTLLGSRQVIEVMVLPNLWVI